jgi:hypothetical protein
MEDSGIAGYNENEVELGKAIGMVLLHNIPITKLVSLNFLPDSMIAVQY